jgi:hypothetical protein
MSGVLSAAIFQAFAECPEPTSLKMVGVHGINASGISGRWDGFKIKKDAESFVLNSQLGQDLLYMGADAVRAYLPEMMRLFIDRPKACDDDALFFIVGFLERSVGISKDHLPVHLNSLQVAAVGSWLVWIDKNLDKFVADYEIVAYKDKLQKIIERLSELTSAKDFDQNGMV